jgi:hypothetical protein
MAMQAVQVLLVMAVMVPVPAHALALATAVQEEQALLAPPVGQALPLLHPILYCGCRR